MAEFDASFDSETGEFTFTFGALTKVLPAGTQASDIDQERAAWEAEIGESTQPVPQEVSMRQARLALLADGRLDDVETALAALPGDAGRAARIEWEYAGTVTRDSDLIISLGAQLGLTDQKIDDLFRAAALIP